MLTVIDMQTSSIQFLFLSFRRTTVTRFALLSALLVLALTAPARSEDPKDNDSAVDGTWQATSAELGGKKFPKDVTETIKLTLKNGTYEVMAESADRGTVTYDTKAKPKAMEIKGTEGPNKGKTFLAIYKLSDDKLTICYDLSGTARPTEFKSLSKSKIFLVTYEKQKS
jgi:uncharacterized protein (TIGR03067 family)